MPRPAKPAAGRRTSIPRPPTSMRERAYRHIQDGIQKGVLRPGTVVSELALSRQLGSSRTPIREAVGRLTAEGLLAQGPHGTSVVVELHREDVVELYELREALEVYAIGKANGTAMRSADRERLQAYVDEASVLRNELERSGERALNEAQMMRFMASDLAFHSLLISLAHNTRMQKVLDDSRLLVRIFAIHREGHDKAMLSDIHVQHQRILDCVLAGQTEQARARLSEHITRSLQERLADFNHWRSSRYMSESSQPLPR